MIICRSRHSTLQEIYLISLFLIGCIIHVEIINNKIWIQRDGTEYGIANELVNAGIPKSQIVLAFHPQDVRKYTEFAIN